MWRIANLNENNRVYVFGHGGMGYRSALPMDSEASIKECVSSGADGAEVDLQLSADSVFYLFHNERLEQGTTCSGKISEHKTTELDECRFRRGNKKHALLRADRLFEMPMGRMLTLECKYVGPGDAGRARYARALGRLLAPANTGTILIESSDLTFIRLLSKAMPSLRTYYYCTSYLAGASARDSVSFEGITIDMDRITASEIVSAHQRGLRVSVFNASTREENADALLLSPDQIQSDLPAQLVKAYNP